MKNNHQKLSAKGLHKRYGKRWVVRDVDLNVNKGEIVGLLGPNGAGKTTTFYMITGMIKPTKGQIYLDDNEITDKGYINQSSALTSRKVLVDKLYSEESEYEVILVY